MYALQDANESLRTPEVTPGLLLYLTRLSETNKRAIPYGSRCHLLQPWRYPSKMETLSGRASIHAVAITFPTPIRLDTTPSTSVVTKNTFATNHKL